jgi:glycerol-3-phosphate acyltransferase PlsY
MGGPPPDTVLLALTEAPAPLVAGGVIAGFVLGSIPFAYLLGRLRGLDLRRVGSGNVGATNLGRNAGFRLGLLAFLLDAAKGCAAVLGVRLAGGDQGAAALAGGAAVVGHCFSPFLRFRGGKGVATMAGVLAFLDPWTCLLLVAVWGAGIAALRNVGISSSLTAVVAIGLGVWSLSRVSGGARPGLDVVLIGLALLVLVKHRSNIRRYFAAAPAEGR